MYYCTSCKTIFSEYPNHDINEFNNCIIAGCLGSVIHIDENLIHIIMMLNEKGYSTRNSCAGHAHDKVPNIYIQFNSTLIADKYDVNMAAVIRENFSDFFDLDELNPADMSYCTMRYTYRHEGGSAIDKQLELLMVLEYLVRRVRRLDSLITS